jgi:holo-[acyl-carrier protein] synthase
VFTQDEVAYCDGRRIQHFAARWAAKEAFIKAAPGILEYDVNYLDIETAVGPAGRPLLRGAGGVLRWAEVHGLATADVSLSHSRGTAVAVVVLHFDRRGRSAGRTRRRLTAGAHSHKL